jgi:glycosyltransferase involved in cell wall biosynthesis
MSEEEILFTVFTPTYNRANLLPRVYASLQKQTYQNFEWIIIDDGSTDGTGELVKQWQQQAGFSIIYQWQPNQGKHIAYNAVAKLARGLLFTSIDSDDEIVPETYERLKYYWDNFTAAEKEYIGGISFVGKNQHGEIVGIKYPKDYQVMDLMEMYLVHGVTGDKGGVIQTRALKMYPFPGHIKNVVVGEGSFMYQMAKDWKMCFVNDVLGIFWIEGRSDSLSLASTSTKNYAGSHYVHLCFLNYNMRFFTRRPKLCMGEATRYSRLSFHLGINVVKQFAALKPFFARLLWLVCLPLGFAFFVKDKLVKK